LGSLLTSERLASSVVSLPLYPELGDDEVSAVGDALRAAAS
jgi:dTDP-4-amino-4,6-dideoxygalactose transaminase